MEFLLEKGHVEDGGGYLRQAEGDNEENIGGVSHLEHSLLCCGGEHLFGCSPAVVSLRQYQRRLR